MDVETLKIYRGKQLIQNVEDRQLTKLAASKK